MESETKCLCGRSEKPSSLDELRSQICPNPSDRFMLANTVTGQHVYVPCNVYRCPVCGPRKLAKLRKAATAYFDTYKHVRMWTVTLASELMQDPIDHYLLLRECWKRFITEIRRNIALSDAQKHVQYFRCVDYHETGYTHYHILVNQFIDAKILRPIWEHICQQVTGRTNHTGTLHIGIVPSARAAANYAVKYVSKAIQFVRYTTKRWSKSKDYRLFPPKKKNDEWVLLDMSKDLYDQFYRFQERITFTSTPNAVTSQALADNIRQNLLFDG